MEFQEAGEYAQDRVSRGWDYLGLEYKSPFLSNLQQHLDLRFYCDCQGWGAVEKEDSIFWVSHNQQAKINDYDGIRWIVGGIKLPSKLGQLRMELKTGNRNLEAIGNLSGKFFFQIFLVFL